MTNTLLNISGKIDPDIANVLATVNQVLAELKMPYVVVGATARDLLLHYGHGAEIQRATEDIDFAIEVPDWHAFDVLKNKLTEKGFRKTPLQHRLISPSDMKIDIVPFGGIEDEQASISWPPKGDVVMNMLGFKEACDQAEWLRLQDKPALDIPVATPEGMALLKIIAWTDRDLDLRKKDAKDIAYLLTSYESIPEVTDSLYANTRIMETYEWDITQAAACLLGQRASHIAKANTLQMIQALADEALGKLSMDVLVEEMCTHIENEFDRKQQLLTAFMEGMNGS